jgi:hypothetical protein
MKADALTWSDVYSAQFVSLHPGRLKIDKRKMTRSMQVVANMFRFAVASLASATTLGLLAVVMAVLWPRPTAAAPVPVRFVEGVAHGFLVLRTVNGVVIGRYLVHLPAAVRARSKQLYAYT